MNGANVVEKVEQVGVVGQMSEVFTQQSVDGALQIERVIDGDQSNIVLYHQHTTTDHNHQQKMPSIKDQRQTDRSTTPTYAGLQRCWGDF